MTEFDPIALIEGAYRPTASRGEWIETQGAAVVPHLHDAPLYGGAGVAYFVGRDGPGKVATVGGAAGAPRDLSSVVTEGARDLSPGAFERVARATRTPGIASLAEIAGRGRGERITGEVFDSYALSVPLNSEGSVVFANFMPQRVALDASTRALWRRVAVHLSAALRLVGKERELDSEGVDAVLAPDGRVQHAKGEAKAQADSLRDAVRAIDRARTRAGRADPHAALALWRGLLAGRWSLIEHFDHDGRRYMLARRNAPQIEEPARLTRRERQVVFYASLGWSNSEIGYALGLEVSTIGTHLARAMKKLGLASRAELVQLASTLAAAGSPP